MTTMYDLATAYASGHPKRSNGTSWNGYCGALMYQFNGHSRAYNTATLAISSTTIESTNAAAAPVGAYHLWKKGSTGHVGVDLVGGGSAVFMASSHLATSWGTAIGINSVAGYGMSSGFTYLGWSMKYGVNGGKTAASNYGVAPAVAPTPAAAAWAFNPPAASVQKSIQSSLTKRKRYSGLVNGIWGTLSIKGIQTTIKQAGFYTGPVNGIPGVNTCLGVQRYAAKFGGYTGPINGILGVNGWAGFARGLAKGL